MDEARENRLILIEKLKELCSSEDYVIGVITYLKTEENFAKMLDFIDALGDDVTPDYVSLYALELNDEHPRKRHIKILNKRTIKILNKLMRINTNNRKY